MTCGHDDSTINIVMGIIIIIISILLLSTICLMRHINRSGIFVNVYYYAICDGICPSINKRFTYLLTYVTIINTKID